MKKVVRRTLLVVSLVIGIPLLLVMSCVAQIGAGVYSAANNVSKDVVTRTKETNNNIVLTADGITISATLHEKPSIKLPFVMLCEQDRRNNIGFINNFTDSSSEILFGDTQVPKSLTIMRMINNQCVEQTISDTTPYIVNHYVTFVGIDHALAKQLGILTEPNKSHEFKMSYSGNFNLEPLVPTGTTLDLPGTNHQVVAPTAHSIYTNVTALMVNDAIRLTFTYDSKPLQDEFMIGSKRIQLQFSAQ